MSAVYISQQAVDDLKNIFSALVSWPKGPLELEHALQYVDDIENKCYSLANKTYHFRTSYSTHKLYGDKVLTYRRNPATIWYIIYNIDQSQNILITKIISNHLTVEK
jgi:plasmid stabilization system protein ParE